MSSPLQQSSCSPTVSSHFSARVAPADANHEAKLAASTSDPSRRVVIEHCVIKQIAAHASRTPQSIAISSGDQQITYADLDRRSNQIAHYLIEAGVKRETIVALCLTRSVAAVVWSLGILKAGGAYLPLDPAYPQERLAFMLQDAQPRVLVTRRELAAELSGGAWVTCAIDGESAELEQQPASLPDVETTQADLAYVIYTSGSTGQPKGVQVTRGNLSNLILWHQQAFAITAADRASHLAGLGFDAAVWEVWPYLAAGASLFLPDDCTRLAPERLRDWLVAKNITVSFLPTALAERVMTLAWPGETALRILLTGAETLHRFPARDLPFQLVNNYGPTECTVVATSGAINPDQQKTSLPSIGRPISNTEIHILDENLMAVPTGAAGEVYIGGAGVARGYLNRPELTREKFIPNPFEPGSRLYRTGDLACLLENGELAYLGRIDDQIKILGYRIEPAEIVSVLDRHQGIQSSVVMARTDGGSEKHLVAYIVPNANLPLSAGELQSFLRQELPEHMIPVLFVQLESLPLTPNGKVDRAALPPPDTDNTLRDEEFVAPRSPIEKRLAEMLASLLGLDQVGITDNFFMLGGHSLLGTQLISHLRGAFGIELGLRTLFDAPTIEQLALEVEQLVMARVEAMSEEEVMRLLS